MRSDNTLNAIEFDVYDNDRPNDSNVRGSYFQRHVTSDDHSVQWRDARQVVLDGQLDKCEGVSRSHVVIGIFRVHGFIWLYRFRLGLHDRFGRSGRLVFVIVRCRDVEQINAAPTCRLLRVASELEGTSEDVLRLERELANQQQAVSPVEVDVGRVSDALGVEASRIAELCEPGHYGVQVDGEGTIVRRLWLQAKTSNPVARDSSSRPGAPRRNRRLMAAVIACAIPFIGAVNAWRHYEVLDEGGVRKGVIVIWRAERPNAQTPKGLPDAESQAQPDSYVASPAHAHGSDADEVGAQREPNRMISP